MQSELEVKPEIPLPKDIKSVEGFHIDEHQCFSCGSRFAVEGVEFCPECNWAKCPHCGGCACTLTPEAKKAVDALYNTFCQFCYNPCQKGRHHKKIPTKADGTVDEDAFAERYPDAYKYYKEHGMDKKEKKK